MILKKPSYSPTSYRINRDPSGLYFTSPSTVVDWVDIFSACQPVRVPDQKKT
jgi:hypothetical protein